MSDCGKGWGPRCAASRGKRCRCSCGGSNHGKAHDPKRAPEGEWVPLPPFVRQPQDALACAPRVGAVYRLLRPCLGNGYGAIAVCYEVYAVARRNGYSFLFPNGANDDFSPWEVDRHLKPVGVSPALQGYQFTNVMQLAEDHRRGVFTPAFEAAGQALIDEAFDFLWRVS